MEPEEAIQQPSLAAEAADPLPPFRSAKTFPLSPKEERLPALYPECLQALKDANTARQQLKLRMAKKKQAIAEIRKEIERFEQDLALEAEARVRLHSLNEYLIGALRDMESMANDMATTAEEANRAPRTGLKRYIDKLKSLARNWKAFKAGQPDTAAVQAIADGHDDQIDA